MKKLHKVDMLPTEDKSAIHIYENGKLFYSQTKVKSSINQYGYQAQHLYFTSDEEIKEGDNIYNLALNCIQIASEFDNGFLQRKIVATTDKKLTHQDDEYTLTKNANKISQQFQEEYVKAGGIDEVYLEYTNKCKTNPQECEWNQCRVSGECSNAKITDISYLKLDQNNCVIIHPVKPKLYTPYEVEQLIRDFYDDFCKDTGNHIERDNWIKENLK